jgi:hypothetical protein
MYFSWGGFVGHRVDSVRCCQRVNTHPTMKDSGAVCAELSASHAVLLGYPGRLELLIIILLIRPFARTVYK